MCKYRKVCRSLFLSYVLWGFSLLSGILLTSCSKENSSGLSVEEGGELRLGAAIAGVSRATDAGFEVNDTLGVYITKWKDAATPDTLKESGNYVDNVFFWLESLNNNWLPEYSVYYPSDDNKIDLYAYYPYRPFAFVSGTSLSLMVASDQSVGNSYTRSDFMTAKRMGVSRSANKVPLIFDHRLSQMVFVLKPGAGFSVSDLLSARIRIVNAIVDGSFNLRDTLPVAGSERSDIIPAGSWTAGSESLTGKKAILIPQELTPETYVEIRLGNRRFTYRPSSVHLNPGCSRTFTITVNNTGLDITTTINPWDNCPPVNGDANEEFDAIVSMTTSRQDPTFAVEKNGDIVVDWGDGTIDTNRFNHVYTDGVTSHHINFYGATDVLKKLYCHNNQLTALDVSKSIALEQLRCHMNLLTALNVNNNTALFDLRCDGNQLVSLDVNNNTALSIFYCSDNRLTSLNTSNNIALFDFRCDRNQLTSLDVSKNIVLSELYCHHNNLTSLDVSNNTALNNLYCGNNHLTSLDVSKNTALLNILCYDNQLVSLNVDNNTALVSLNCGNNNLTSLDVSKNVVLSELYCYNNRLTLLDISKNIKLSALQCYDNQLGSLDISNNTQLVSLWCTQNPFFTDQSILTALANSLPDRTGQLRGNFIVDDSVSVQWIQALCDAKNWKLQVKI